MTARKPTTKKRVQVWRISPEHPQGHWVDPAKSLKVPPKDTLPEVSYGGWASSSFDLLSGVDVSDDPADVPDALFDELFAPKEDGLDDLDRPDVSKPDGPSPP